MTQRILADPYTTTSIEYGDELKFVSTAPLTNGTDGVFKAVEQWKGEDFARAFKLKGFRAAWEKLVQPGKASINKIHAFFKYYRLAYTCLNVAHEIVVRWKPEQDGMSHNRKLGDSHFFFIQHNDHMYPLDKDQESLQRKQFHDASQAIPRSPSTTMKPPKAFTYTLYAPTRDDLVNILRRPLSESGVSEDRILVSIAYGEDIEDLYLWLIQTHNYEAQPIIKERKFVGLKLFLQQIVVVHGGFNKLGGDMSAFASLKAFNDALNSFKRAMFHSSHKSTYSQDLLHIFTDGRKAQLTCRFDADAPDMSVGVDVRNAYPSAGRYVDYIPVFLKTDRFRHYQGEPLEDYSIYLVRNEDFSDTLRYIIADRPVCAVSGWVLKRCGLTFPIVAVCKPTHLAHNPYKSLLKDLFKNQDVDNDSKKNVANYIIGMMGKTMNRREEGFFCTTYDEAKRLSNDVCPRTPLGGWIATRKSKDVVFTDGFYPFQFMVYDINRWQMMTLARTLMTSGSKVYGILTDKIYCDVIPADLPLISKAERTYKTLGGYKAEGLEKTPRKLREINPPVSITIRPDATFTDVDAILPKQNTFVEGSAGTRKTMACFTNLPPATTLCVCPNNAQRDQVSQRFGCAAITTHEFLGLRVCLDGGNETNGRPHILAKYTHVVFEELFQNSIPLIVAIVDRVLETQGITFISNGDPFQNNNAEAMNNVGKRDAYIRRILPEAFPYRLHLTTNYRLKCRTHPVPADNPLWRCECPFLLAERERMTAIREALKQGKDIAAVVQEFGLNTITQMNDLERHGVKRAITQSNASAHALNQFLYPEDDHVGMLVVAKPFKSSKLLIKNKEYRVEGITSESYLIDGKEFPKRLFRRPAGQTCDAIQGATITAPYAIIDVVDDEGKTSPYINRRWFYTALSRTEYLDKVWIYTGAPIVSMKDAEEKVKRYKEDDEAKGRPGGLSVRQMMDQLKYDNYCCWICHQRVEVVYEYECRRQYSMDRINNDLGHKIGNVRTAHLGCNSAQGNDAKIRDISQDDSDAEE